MYVSNTSSIGECIVWYSVMNHEICWRYFQWKANACFHVDLFCGLVCSFCIGLAQVDSRERNLSQNVENPQNVESDITLSTFCFHDKIKMCVFSIGIGSSAPCPAPCAGQVLTSGGRRGAAGRVRRGGLSGVQVPSGAHLRGILRFEGPTP